MERSGLSRILLAVGVFVAVYLLFNRGGCGGDKGKGPNTLLVYESDTVLALPPGSGPSEPCVIETDTYKATVAQTGGGLLSYELKGQKYIEEGKPIDIARRTTVSTAGTPMFQYAPLRTSFRDTQEDNQLPGDLPTCLTGQKWAEGKPVLDANGRPVAAPACPELVAFAVHREGSACVLAHRTPDVAEITRVVRPGQRPYELELETTVKNLAKETKKHAFSTSLFAVQLAADEGGMLSRPSPNAVFKAGCAVNGKLELFDKGSAREWKLATGAVDYTAIASSYIGQAIIPNDSHGAHCAVIAQDRVAQPGENTMFRAVLSYPRRELGPDQSITYKQLAFIGPKERGVLAAAAGGGRHVDDLIELGMFAVIAKQLVRFLAFVHGLIGSWGIAIIILTVTVRVLLLPLTLPQIRSSLAMRRLKPELDALNSKFEHDPQAKMLATSQLYKKHGVNPLAGCLPAVMQMPVWFALYTALQTAMELYHEKFLFWSDLSAPDPRFILPLVLGATMFFQQKITPMQMDPAQQKVFLYFMPAMFTVFMLFLPAGLGVYMLTNSVLGIAQTLAVESYYKKQGPPEVKVTQVEEKPAAGDKGGKGPRSARELARKDS
ncbi:MAG: YidC/Oxa1 family insertase periplasmic-domain containing protein [Deltaproteobacteria bacterium]|nr:YidC/Oxa1 family insertase periplasmic-domain containing protein [Deltaproteobacteria bacterium]